MNTSAYEAKINAILTAQLPVEVEIDELGNTLPADDYRAKQLSFLSQEIRRTCWNPEVKEQADKIADRADQIAADLLGKGRPEPLPRFEAFVSGGHIVRAIR